MPRKRSGVIGWSSDLKTMVLAMDIALPINATINDADDNYGTQSYAEIEN